MLLLRIRLGNSSVYKIINFCSKLPGHRIQVFLSGDPSLRIFAVSKKNRQGSSRIHCQNAQNHQNQDSAQQLRKQIIHAYAKPVSNLDDKYAQKTPDTGSRNTDITIQVPFHFAVIPPSLVVPHLDQMPCNPLHQGCHNGRADKQPDACQFPCKRGNKESAEAIDQTERSVNNASVCKFLLFQGCQNCLKGPSCKGIDQKQPK